MPTQVSKFVEEALILQVTICAPGNSKQLGEEEYQVEADKKRTRAAKFLLKSPELDAYKKEENAIRNWLSKIQLKGTALAKGCYLFTIGMVETVDTALLKRFAKLDALAAEAVRMYPQRIEEASLPKDKGGLGELFNRENYLTTDEYAQEFEAYSRYRPFPGSAPDALKQIPSIYAREQKDIASDTVSTEEIARLDVRKRFREANTRLITALSPTKSGAKARLYETAITSYQELLTMFPAMNAALGDEEIAPLMAQAQEILDGLTKEQLDDDERLSTKVREGLEKLVPTAVALTRPKRLVTLDEPAAA